MVWHACGDRVLESVVTHTPRKLCLVNILLQILLASFLSHEGAFMAGKISKTEGSDKT